MAYLLLAGLNIEPANKFIEKECLTTTKDNSKFTVSDCNAQNSYGCKHTSSKFFIICFLIIQLLTYFNMYSTFIDYLCAYNVGISGQIIKYLVSSLFTCASAPCKDPLSFHSQNCMRLFFHRNARVWFSFFELMSENVNRNHLCTKNLTHFLLSAVLLMT